MSERRIWFRLTMGTFFAGGVASVWSDALATVLFACALALALLRLIILIARSERARPAPGDRPKGAG